MQLEACFDSFTATLMVSTGNPKQSLVILDSNKMSESQAIK